MADLPHAFPPYTYTYIHYPTEHIDTAQAAYRIKKSAPTYLMSGRCYIDGVVY